MGGWHSDYETGLERIGQRYYDPNQGRFTTSDPAGYAGGLNLFAFAGCSPINFIDPTGNDWATAGAWIGGIAGFALSGGNPLGAAAGAAIGSFIGSYCGDHTTAGVALVKAAGAGVMGFIGGEGYLAGGAIGAAKALGQAYLFGVLANEFEADTGVPVMFCGTLEGAPGPGPVPRGFGALKAYPQLENDPYVASQPAVHGEQLDRLIRAMNSGNFNWAGNEIEANGNAIVNGHHRYLAARILGVEPVIVPSDWPVDRTFSWWNVLVSKAQY